MNTTVRNTLIFTLLVSTAGMAAAADAQVPTPTKAPKLFQQADANKDGKLDAAEFAKLEQLRDERMQQLQAQRPDFKTLDKDGDGSVSQEEMRAGMPHKMMHNNKMPRHGDSLYAKADANKDGNLDKAEYGKLLELRKERQAKIEAATPDFATLDKNGDGVISKDELRDGMRAVHEKLRSAE